MSRHKITALAQYNTSLLRRIVIGCAVACTGQFNRSVFQGFSFSRLNVNFATIKGIKVLLTLAPDVFFLFKARK